VSFGAGCCRFWAGQAVPDEVRACGAERFDLVRACGTGQLNPVWWRFELAAVSGLERVFVFFGNFPEYASAVCTKFQISRGTGARVARRSVISGSQDLSPD
jgi:hypothetical protein